MKRLLFLFILSMSSVAFAQGDSFGHECPDVSYQNLTEENFLSLKNTIESRLNALDLNVVWKGPRFGSRGTPFKDTPQDLARLKTLSKIVVPALEKYSPAFFNRIRLRNIVLVKDLVVVGQLRKAMPQPSSSSLFYADNNDLECLAGMEERVHHELYHFVEERINGSMYFRDGAWMSLNSEDFHYGRGGKTVYNLEIPFQNIGHPQEGFVSQYATTAIEEDKAEVFGWAMTSGYSERLWKWTQEDSILLLKTQQMQDAMKELELLIQNKSSALNGL